MHIRSIREMTRGSFAAHAACAVRLVVAHTYPAPHAVGAAMVDEAHSEPAGHGVAALEPAGQ
jgi:hypothetical protein